MLGIYSNFIDNQSSVVVCIANANKNSAEIYPPRSVVYRLDRALKPLMAASLKGGFLNETHGNHYTKFFNKPLQFTEIEKGYLENYDHLRNNIIKM